MSWFNHKAAAVDGVGFGHRVLAVLGLRWFEVEIIVRPGGGGGGSGPKTIWDNAEDYTIIVRVKYKGKVWEEKRTISALTLKSIEKVLASFKFMKVKAIEITASINTIVQRTIDVIWRK